MKTTTRKPTHPGAFIKQVYIAENNISSIEIVKNLGISKGLFSRLINEKMDLTPRMALRLSKTLGGSAESWMNMQTNNSLWIAENTEDLTECVKLQFVI